MCVCACVCACACACACACVYVRVFTCNRCRVQIKVSLMPLHGQGHATLASTLLDELLLTKSAVHFICGELLSKRTQ